MVESVGTLSEERVNELFDKDCQVMIDECKILYPNFDDLLEEKTNNSKYDV